MTANRAKAMDVANSHADRRDANHIALGELKERKRHNRADETAKAFDIGSKYAKVASDTIKSAAGLALSNHPDWYMKIPGADVVGNVNAYKIGGVPYLLPYKYGDTVERNEVIVPQIVTLGYYPTIGETTRPNPNSLGIHTQHLVQPSWANDFTHIAQELFAFLRKSNGGSLNGLDPSDMLEAVLAFSEGMGLVSHLKRLYRLINTWEAGERTLPAQLILALYGVSGGNTPEQQLMYWSTHKLELLSIINTLIKRINTLTVPTSFAYALRRMYVNENVFVEQDKSVNNKFYAYKPFCILKWLDTPIPVTQSSGVDYDVAVLGTYDMSSGIRDLTDIANVIQDVIDPLFDSTDLAMVCSYFLNSYKEDRSKLMYMAPVDIDERQEFNMDEHFGDQIRNTHCYGGIPVGSLTSQNGVGQFSILERLSTGQIWQNKRLLAQTTISGDPISLLNVEHAKRIGELSREEVFEYTRGSSIVMSVVTDNTVYDYVRLCGTEYVSEVRVCGMDRQGNWAYANVDNINVNASFGTQQFKYLPCFISDLSVAYPYSQGSMNCKLFTFTVLDFATLQQIHKVANYSVFSVDEPSTFKATLK